MVYVLGVISFYLSMAVWIGCISLLLLNPNKRSQKATLSTLFYSQVACLKFALQCLVSSVLRFFLPTNLISLAVSKPLANLPSPGLSTVVQVFYTDRPFFQKDLSPPSLRHCKHGSRKTDYSEEFCSINH